MSCACGSEKMIKLVYACSGAANAGMLADHVARIMKKDGTGSMTCLAGLGAELSGFKASAESAGRNIVLDGCAIACGAKIFDKLGLSYQHILMTNYGVIKGETIITPELIDQITDKVVEASA